MLSVVIPVYNGSDSLRELCESLKLLFSLNQWDYEIISIICRRSTHYLYIFR